MAQSYQGLSQCAQGLTTEEHCFAAVKWLLLKHSLLHRWPFCGHCCVKLLHSKSVSRATYTPPQTKAVAGEGAKGQEEGRMGRLWERVDLTPLASAESLPHFLQPPYP